MAQACWGRRKSKEWWPVVRTEHSPRGVRSEGASCLAMKSAERMPNDTLRIEAK